MNLNHKFPPPPTAQQPATLGAALRNAAVELQQRVPPPELQARVLAAAHAAGRPAATTGSRQRLLAAGPTAAAGPVPRPRKGWWAWSGAAACAAVLAGSAWLMLRVPLPARVDEGVRFSSSGQRSDRGGQGGAFLPLVPPERWPREAAPAWLVSTELPGERLAALGLPYDPAHAGDSVRAELLLHPSGEVLAVRFLH